MRRCLFTAVLTLALSAVPASANVRYASPSATATTPCSQAQPCKIEAAVNEAGPGDEVIVTPGTYTVRAPLSPAYSIDLHGAYDQPRPRLTGAVNLNGTTLTLEHGETVSHLEVRSLSTTHNALQIKGAGAFADRLVIWAGKAHAAKLVPSSSTVLRNSVVQTMGGAADIAALKLMDGAPGQSMDISNVTAIASQGVGIGIRCEAVKSVISIRNTVARGAESDIEADNAGAQCSVASSNFRTAESPGLTSSNEADPAFTDPADDFYPTALSPLVNQGSSTGGVGTSDLAGRARVLGGTPDIGAYERDGTATVSDPASAGPLGPSDLMPPDGPSATKPEEKPAATPKQDPTPAPQAATPSPALPAVPAILLATPRGLSELPAGVTPPVLGSTAVVAPAAGVVKVKVAGARTSTTLKAGDEIPLNSVIDARAGSVKLSTATSDGFQTATFSGGQFEVRQPRGQGGMTDVVLRGGDFSKCAKRKTTTARAAAKRKPVRRLWGSDRNGRFRTHGSSSVATVRGTKWLTEDHCHGTLTRVTEGAVDVRDRRTGRTTRVRAGSQKLVRR